MKLVRDKIPELHATGLLGPHPSGVDRNRQVFRKATPEEYRLLLYVKLAEEVGEIVSAMTHEQRMSEIGDLEDLIYAIKVFEGHCAADVERRFIKSRDFGRFTEGWILEWKPEADDV